MRALMLFIIGLTFGAAGGFVFAAANGITLDGHDHTNAADHGLPGQDGTLHAIKHDQPLDLDSANAPTLEISVLRDPVAGHNLHVDVAGFAFAPQAAGLAHVPGEGHAHVYVNGVKLGRLYGAWMHLEDLPSGEVVIDVTLNANDHRPLAISGSPITARDTIHIE